MPLSLFAYVLITWFELSLFIFILPAVFFLGVGYKVRFVPILHLLRRRFINHFVVDGERVASHIVLLKDTKVYGATRFIPYGGEWYIYRPEKKYLFHFGGVASIAHKAHVPMPLEFANAQTYIFQTPDPSEGQFSAQEIHDAIDSKVTTDFHRSMYETKDMLFLVAIFVIALMEVINIYFAYTVSQNQVTILNYFAHYFSTTTP